MSEILDQSADALLHQRLSENDAGKKVFIGSEDPIGLYNHVVKQFNAACNRTTESSYERLDPNCFYGVWMLRWWTLVRCDTSYIMLFITFCVNFLIGLIPIVNIINVMVWLICYLIYERNQRPHSRVNKQLSSDPFKYMIYHNGLCKQGKLYNLYYELPVSSLSSLGLRESQLEIIKSKKSGSTVTFMVYGDRFKAAWSKFGLLRIVHIIQILVALLGLIIANVLVYPKTHINEFFQST